jgi:hypothetical protein
VTGASERMIPIHLRSVTVILVCMSLMVGMAAFGQFNLLVSHGVDNNSSDVPVVVHKQDSSDVMVKLPNATLNLWKVAFETSLGGFKVFVHSGRPKEFTAASSIRKDFFLFYQQAGGWNNQRISFAEAVMLGQCLNRTVVVHDGEFKNTRFPLSHNVDVIGFSRHVHPVMELGSFLQKYNGAKLFPMLRFSHVGYYGMSLTYFRDKYPGLFSHHQDIAGIQKPMDCSFYSQIIEKRFPNERVLGFDELYFSFAMNDYTFQLIHESICAFFKREIKQVSLDFVEQAFGGEPFLAAHWRRLTGWGNHCKAFAKGSDYSHCMPSLQELVHKIRTIMNETGIAHVYIASDQVEDIKELELILPIKTLTTKNAKQLSGNNVGILEQLICSASTLFIGNKWSTFSGFIILQRGDKPSLFY